MAVKYKNNDRRMYIFLAVSSLIVFLLSASVMPFSMKPTADLMLCFVVVIPCFASKKAAYVTAVLLGFFADLFINAPTCFSPVVYLACTAIVPLFHRYFARMRFTTAAVCAIPSIALRALVGTVTLMASFKGATLSSVLSRVILPEMVINFAFTLVCAFVCIFVVEKFRINRAL